MSGYRLRAMTADDCEGVAEIRVRGWQHAYRGVVPRSYLDGLDVAAEAERYRARLEETDGPAVNLVAETGEGALAGWAAFGPYRDAGTLTGDGELYALYLRPDHIGRGVGRALLTEASRPCTAAGRPRMSLWVLRANLPAAASTHARASPRTAWRSPSRWTGSWCRRCGM